MKKSVLNFLLLFGVYISSFVYIAWRHYKTIRDGGHNYLQGDWLINFAAGPVRRGLSGEFFLFLGEQTGINPIFLLGFAQFGMLVLLLCGLLYLAISRGLTDGLTLALLSPALVVFWVTDQDAPFRKEWLGYLVFLPLLLSRKGTPSILSLTSSALLLGIAISFHEANAAFALPSSVVLWLILERARALFWCGVFGLVTVAATAFSLLNMSVSDVGLICQRLMETGMEQDICGGAIAWLELDFNSVVSEGRTLVAIFGGVKNFVLAALWVSFLFVTLIWLMRKHISDLGTVFALGFSIMAFLPLYLLGADWGRWVSIQMFALLFVIIALAKKHAEPTVGGEVRLSVYFPLLAAYLSVGVYHMVPVPTWGFLHTYFTGVQNLLN